MAEPIFILLHLNVYKYWYLPATFYNRNDICNYRLCLSIWIVENDFELFSKGFRDCIFNKESIKIILTGLIQFLPLWKTQTEMDRRCAQGHENNTTVTKLVARNRERSKRMPRPSERCIEVSKSIHPYVLMSCTVNQVQISGLLSRTKVHN